MTGTLPARVRAVSLGTRDYKICGVFAVQGGFNQSLSVSLQLRPVYSFAIKYSIVLHSQNHYFACRATAGALLGEKWGKVTDRLYFVKNCAAGVGWLFVSWPFNYSSVHKSCLL